MRFWHSHQCRRTQLAQEGELHAYMYLLSNLKEACHSVCFSELSSLIRCTTGCSLPLGKRSVRLCAARGWLDSKQKSKLLKAPHVLNWEGVSLKRVLGLAHAELIGLASLCNLHVSAGSFVGHQRISKGHHFRVLYLQVVVGASCFQPPYGII